MLRAAGALARSRNPRSAFRSAAIIKPVAPSRGVNVPNLRKCLPEGCTCRFTSSCEFCLPADRQSSLKMSDCFLHKSRRLPVLPDWLEMAELRHS
jgi:hypothetical protein